MPVLEIAIDARRARTGAEQFERSVDKVARSAKGAGTSVDGLGRELDQSSTSMDRTARSARGATDDVDRLARQSERGARSFSRLTGIVTGLGGAFLGFRAARAAISTIADFEVALATIQGVTGLDRVSADFQAIEDTARRLGATTRFSATESAEGILFLARAGFTARESVEAIPATLDLATAGAIDLGRAADIASNTLSQFGLATTDTQRAVDVFINTTNSANTDVEQLAEALKLAGPIAGALGISLEETSAGLGVLGDSGIQASLAGTNLRGVLSALIGPSGQAQRTIARLGLSIDDLDPSTRSITQIFRQFAEAGLSASDALAIFGRRNSAAALILANSVDRIEELTAANEKSEGVARRNAALIENTLAGSYKSLKSALEEATLASGDAGFSGVLRNIVDFATGATRGILGLKTETDSLNSSMSAGETAGSILGGVLDEIGRKAKQAGFEFQIAKQEFLDFLAASDEALLRGTDVNDRRVPVGAFQTNEESGLDVPSAPLAGPDQIRAFLKAEDERKSSQQELIASLGVYAEDVDFAISRISQFADAVTKGIFEIQEKPVEVFDISSILDDLREQRDIVRDTTGELEKQKKQQDEINSAVEEAREIASEAGQFLGTAQIEAIENAVRELQIQRDINEEITKRGGLVQESTRFVVEGIDKFASAFFGRPGAAPPDRTSQRQQQADAIGRADAATRDIDRSIAGLGFPDQRAVRDEGIVARAREDLEAAGVDADTVSEKVSGIEEGLARLRDGEDLVALGSDIGSSFGQAFSGILSGAVSASEAMRQLAVDITAAILKALILKAVGTAIGGPAGGFIAGFAGGLANGGIVSPSRGIERFARGGRIRAMATGEAIVSRPTYFPLAGGEVGLYGEAGPEARTRIFSTAFGPSIRAIGEGGQVSQIALARDRSGRLGVDLSRVAPGAAAAASSVPAGDAPGARFDEAILPLSSGRAVYVASDGGPSTLPLTRAGNGLAVKLPRRERPSDQPIPFAFGAALSSSFGNIRNESEIRRASPAAATSTGDRGRGQIINVSQTFINPDFDSFKRSRRETARQTSSIFQRLRD